MKCWFRIPSKFYILKLQKLKKGSRLLKEKKVFDGYPSPVNFYS